VGLAATNIFPPAVSPPRRQSDRSVHALGFKHRIARNAAGASSEQQGTSTLICATLVFVAARNITFKLPSDLLTKAKVYAAQHDTTVNSLVRKLLEEKLNSDDEMQAAIDRILASAANGPHFTADLSTIDRDEYHARR
jgi:predicted transcriptional regulator